MKKTALLYVHGLNGSADEAEMFAPYCPDVEVVGADYDGYVPGEVLGEIRKAYDELHERYDRVYLMANSIGAYFSMLALKDCEIVKALFVSPVLDMEKLILGMMSRADVSEEKLREQGEITTNSGIVLSWEYLCYVRDNPIDWKIPTEILYAGQDKIIPRSMVDEFVRGHDAKLTVMEDGEHWFHTEEQLAFLGEWMRRKFS